MDTAAAAGQSAAAPRPSTRFTRTCSLLRQFIKEKGTLGIDIQMTAPTAPTPTATAAVVFEGKSRHIDDTHTAPVFLPDLNGSGGFTASPCPPPVQQQHKPQMILSSDAATGKPPAAPQASAPQLTIFYAGKVFVFDNFPEDKARQFMAAAAAAMGVPTTQSSGAAMVSGNSNIRDHNCASAAAATASTVVAAGSHVHKPATMIPGHDGHRPPPPHIPILASGSDLPIARRVSLNRFLEKRKDRISSKAPYQVAGSPDPTASSKPHQPTSSSDSASPSLGGGGGGESSAAAPSSSKPFPPAPDRATPPYTHGSQLHDKAVGGKQLYTEAEDDDYQEPSSSSAPPVPWLGLAPPPSRTPSRPEK